LDLSWFFWQPARDSCKSVGPCRQAANISGRLPKIPAVLPGIPAALPDSGAVLAAVKRAATLTAADSVTL